MRADELEAMVGRVMLYTPIYNRGVPNLCLVIGTCSDGTVSVRFHPDESPQNVAPHLLSPWPPEPPTQAGPPRLAADVVRALVGRLVMYPSPLNGKTLMGTVIGVTEGPHVIVRQVSNIAGAAARDSYVDPLRVQVVGAMPDENGEPHE